LKYWVIDDQYNDEIYQYIEVYASEALSAKWLDAVVHVLRRYPGWGVGVRNLDRAYLLIFANRLMVTGRTFEDCHDTASVLRAAAANLREAAASSIPDEGHS
jgi:hypothetical protein